MDAMGVMDVCVDGGGAIGDFGDIIEYIEYIRAIMVIEYIGRPADDLDLSCWLVAMRAAGVSHNRFRRMEKKR